MKITLVAFFISFGVLASYSQSVDKILIINFNKINLKNHRLVNLKAEIQSSNASPSTTKYLVIYAKSTYSKFTLIEPLEHSGLPYIETKSSNGFFRIDERLKLLINPTSFRFIVLDKMNVRVYRTIYATNNEFYNIKDIINILNKAGAKPVGYLEMKT